MKKCKSLSMMMLILFTALLFTVSVQAKGGINMKNTGTISVSLGTADGQQTAAGSELGLYYIADIVEKGDDYQFVYAKNFSSCTYSLESFDNAKLTSELTSYISKNKIKVDKTTSISDDNKASFVNLKLGLYLVVETKKVGNISQINPFLVTVPMKGEKGYIYKIDASPKLNVEVSTTPSPDKTPTPTPGITPSGGGNGGSGGGSGGGGGSSRLPQTGQLWWPVPILAVAGLILVAIGWVRRKHAE